MFYHLGRIATRFRWLIVGIWMVAIAIALPFAPQVSQVLHSGGFVSPDAESERAVNLLVQKLHLNPTIVQVIFTSQRYDADSSQFIQESQQALAQVQPWSEVSGIVSFTDNPRQISLDRHAAYVNVLLKPDPDSAPKLLPELEHRLQRVPDLKTSIGGGPVFYEDIQAVSERDLRRAEFLAFPFAIIALLLVFRSVVASILPALVGGSAIVVSLALIFGLGQVTTLSIFVLNITTLFGLGLGVDYSLFLVSRFREELAHGRAVDDAVIAAVATAGRAVTFSGLTVSIGLVGLIFFRINMLRSVGMAGILVVLLAVIAAITLLPAVLAIIGTQVNAFPVRLPKLWGQFRGLQAYLSPRQSSTRAPMPPHAIPAPPDQSTKGMLAETHHGFWYRLSYLVMRYPVQVFVPVLLLLIAFGLPFLGVRFSAPDASILPTTVPSRAAFDLLATRFNARETTPILLAVQTRGNVMTPGNIRNLYYYVQRIEADPRVARVDSIVSADPRFTLDQYELLYTHPQLIADPYLSALIKSSVAGNTTMIQVISKYNMLDQRSQELVLTIRNTPPGNGIAVLVDGGTAGDIDYVNSLYTDFPQAVLIVAITTYVVLLFFFRSVVLPLKAILMNTLSILASYGALVVIFQDGFLHQVFGFTPLGFVEASSPILLFCSLFGLSMDYEVFLLSRVQEAFWQTGDNTRAVALGLQRTGGIITSAAIIVIVVSACFATADMILVKALGLGMALAVALDATLVRGLLVPATMRLLGNLNWWPQGRWRKPHPFVGLQLCFFMFLALILSSCSFPGIVTTKAQLPVVSMKSPTPWLPRVHFPQDEAAHNDLTEWWYYTGHMNAVTPGGTVHHYGFELVFFQVLRSDLPPIYAAHFAISDITRGEFHFDQRRLIEPDAVIPNGTSIRGIDVHIGDWSIQGVNGRDHLAAEMPDYGLHIDLLGLKPPVLHNSNGLITYSLAGFSYYYSRTRMALSGTLIDHSRPLQVRGEAWMDHQWGNFLTFGGGGWDWFSIQLSDNSEMMLYLIRDATGKDISTYVGYIGANASDTLLPASALHVTVLNHWISPATGANYPSGWHIEINDPRLHASLTLMPELKDQELVVYQSTGNSYWEGAVSIEGQSAGNVVHGEGYVELTGYTN